MSLKSAIREAVDARDSSQTEAKHGAEADADAEPRLDSEEMQASSKAINTASNKAVKQAELSHAEPAEMAAMTVRVSRRHRLHWLIAAKREGTSLTAAITEALNARFGEPGE